MRKIICLSVIFWAVVVNAQTISTTGALITARWKHCSELLPDGRVIAFGGDNDVATNLVAYQSAEVYNPQTGTWTATASMNRRRTSFASVLLNNGNILAIGGELGSNTGLTRSCEIYDVASGTWAYTDSLNTPRYLHAAVRLLNGKVLVAGGNTITCEIYNPSSGTWSSTGSLSISRGDGVALTLLADGRVLATGGSSFSAQNTAEIYDPSTGLWSSTGNMVGNRFYHSSVLLNNGNVLVCGAANFNDQTTAEIFDPSTNSFSPTGGLQEGRSLNPLILMDNGSPLIFGLGDLMTPGNTQCIEVFDNSFGTWSSNPYTVIGSQAYTIHRLHNGNILIIGGTVTSGAGASSNCYLVTQPYSGPCTPVNTTLSAVGSSVCVGSGGSITINTSESNASYQAMIGSTPVSSSVTGGGNINLTVPALNLSAGNNIISVKVSRSGCLFAFLSDTANILVDPLQPVVIPYSSTNIYACDSVTLAAPQGYASYLWSTGDTTQTITVNLGGSYKVKVTSSAGCQSLWSDSIDVIVNAQPTSVVAGANQNVCINSSPIQLMGYSPPGGTWTGPGIVMGDYFDPTLAGLGTHMLTYTICNVSATKNITVDSLVAPSVSILISSGSNPSPSNTLVTFSATILNGGSSPVRQWKLNGVNVGSNSASYSNSNLQNGDQVSCILTSNATCISSSTDTSNIITMSVMPRPVITTVSPISNQGNVSQSSPVIINFSTVMDSIIADTSVHIHGSLSGHRVLPSTCTVTGSGSDSLRIDFLSGFLPGEEVSWSVNTLAKDTNGFSLLTAAGFSYYISAGPGPATFYSPGTIFQPVVANTIVSADFTGDQIPDFCISDMDNVYIFENDGLGNFSQVGNFIFFCSPTHAMAGDIDNDGDIDILARCGQQLKIIRNDGNSSFTNVPSFTNYTLFGSAQKTCLYDYNSDGDLDVIFTTSSGQVGFLANDGQGNFSAGGSISNLYSPYAIALGDMDNDRDMDIVISGGNSSGQSAAKVILRNPTSYTPLPEVSIIASSATRGICLLDRENDGDLDVAIIRDAPNGVSLLTNNGSGTIGNEINIPFINLHVPHSIKPADYNGDGFMDISVGTKVFGMLLILMNDGQGNFTVTQTYSAGVGDIGSHCTADFDLDGDIDNIMLGDYNSALFINGTVITSTSSYTSTFNEGFKITPNPSSGHFYIETNRDDSEGGIVELYDALGKSVYSSGYLFTPGANRILIEEDFPIGVYYVRLAINSEIYFQKLVIGSY